MVAIKMKTTVKLRASGVASSHSRTEVSFRDISIAIDEPTERGGTNTGPSPTETAIAALIGCTNVIGNKCADALGIDIGHLNVNAICDFDRRGVTLAEEIDEPFQRIELKVTCNGEASQPEIDKVAAEVAKFCPLSKLFRQAGTEIVETWEKSNS